MQPENATETLKKNWATVVTVVLLLLLVVNRVKQLSNTDVFFSMALSESGRSLSERQAPIQSSPQSTSIPADKTTPYHVNSERYLAQMNERVNVKWQVNETQKQALQPTQQHRTVNAGQAVNRSNSSHSSAIGSSNYGQAVSTSSTTSASDSGRSGSVTGARGTISEDPCTAILNKPPPLDVSLYSGTALQWEQDWAFYEQCLAKLRK
jgi:hypothetical protein